LTQSSADKPGDTFSELSSLRTTLIDVTRTSWLDGFFSAWSFESAEALVEAVEATTVDLSSFSRNLDLRELGLSGWGYWFIFVKGWREYRTAGAVEPENTYCRYMRTHFDVVRHDPGLAEVVQDPAQLLARIELRFADLDKLSRSSGARHPGPPEELSPVRIWLQEPPPFGAKLFHEARNSHVIGPGMMDGHHRLFAARLFGVSQMPAEVIAVDADSASADLAGRLGWVLRYTVPHLATIAIAAGEHDRPLKLPDTSCERFPPNAGSDADESELVRQLESGRLENAWRHLLVPAPAIPWLMSRPGLKGHLDENYRLAADDPDLCRLYVIWHTKSDEAADRPGEGLALPPVEMRVLSAGTPDTERFVESGREALGWIRALVDPHARLDDTRAVLDFGCGAGRLLRHLGDLPARLAGVDINPYLIAWSSGNLPFVEATVNSLRPYLPGPSDEWDLVLAIDVFTHLDEPLQRLWIEELERVTKPGGLIILTLNGSAGAQNLAAPLRDTFDAGRLAVERPELAGTSACVAYTPDKFIRAVLASRLELLEHRPGAATDVRQDAILLRRPHPGSLAR
jgi:SAM-dependent methyltransferase